MQTYIRMVCFRGCVGRCRAVTDAELIKAVWEAKDWPSDLVEELCKRAHLSRYWHHWTGDWLPLVWRATKYLCTVCMSIQDGQGNVCCFWPQ